MAMFVKVEMFDKAAYPKPVAINFDHVVSLTPHLSDETRFLLLFERGLEYDVIISEGALRKMLAIDATSLA